jgi:site-specific DNA recombinase
VDGDGQRMTPTHAIKKGRRYRYYVSTQLISGTRSDDAKGRRIPAGDIEGLVLDRLREFFASDRDLGDALSCFDLDASAVRSAMTAASQLVEEWTSLPPIKLREVVRTVIANLIVHDDRVIASLNPTEVATLLLGDEYNVPAARPSGAIELTIDVKLRRAGKGIRLIVGGGVAAKPDGQMVALLHDAHATRDCLMSGRDETIDAMAKRLGIKRDYLSAHMRLTYLAPDIVRALVAGRHPEGLTPAGLLSKCKDLPHDWQLQRAVLGIETT